MYHLNIILLRVMQLTSLKFIENKVRDVYHPYPLPLLH